MNPYTTLHLPLKQEKTIPNCLQDELLLKGPNFLGFESGRLKKLKARHKFHFDHLCGLKKEENILQSFLAIREHMPHDEL